MARSFSIAEARDQLSRLVHEAEAGQAIELTRRGEAVAVLVSVSDYRRLVADKSDFWARFQRFRDEHGVDDLGLEPESWLDGVRDEARARELGW